MIDKSQTLSSPIPCETEGGFDSIEHKWQIQEPTVVHVEGAGDVSGWSSPGPDSTAWELVNGIDVLGPDFERYNERNERFVCDWDDAFKDTGKWWIQAHREALQQFGFSDEETTDQEILKLFGNIHVGNTLGIDRFTKDDVQYTDDEVWVLIKTRARQLLAEHPMDPLLVEALKREAASTKMNSRTADGVQIGSRFAVWSSSPRELLVEAIEANGLQDVFDTIISVDDVENHKPHPEGLFKALKAMDVASGYLEPGEDYSEEKPLNTNGVWMIGDSPNDIKGGKAAGVSTLWLEHPLQAYSARAKRQLALAETATKGFAEVEEVAKALMPTASVRTFDPAEAGMYGQVAAEQIPFEVISNLTTDNTALARFLIDGGRRAGLYREEKVYQALKSQGLGDPTPGLRNVFQKPGKVVYGDRVAKPPMTSEQAQEWLDDQYRMISEAYDH